MGRTAAGETADRGPKLGERQLEHYWFMSVAQRRVEWEIANTLWRGWGLPAEWHEIAMGPREGRREKVTLYLDANVMKFFRAMGRGHHARLNDVLSVWMYGRLARIVRGPEAAELFGPDGLFGAEKPGWDEAWDGDARLMAQVRGE